MLGGMTDKYASFTELAQHEKEGTDYRITAIERPGSRVLIIAPHGGRIEVGTSELAALIAADEHNLFSFEGLKPRGHNRDLHITSRCFDHPACLAILARCSIAVGIHGCVGESQIYVGGLDTALTKLLAERIRDAGLPASCAGHKYTGRHALNICNRGARKRGAQLELTLNLRESATRPRVAAAVRAAICEYLSVLSKQMP